MAESEFLYSLDMEHPMDTPEIRTRAELRQWLLTNHSTERECYVRCRRGKPPSDGSLWYVDVVEEAICFGWIDSTLHPAEDGWVIQRISPRRKGSGWTEKNKERARRMERLGLMTDAGRAALPDMTVDIDRLFPTLMAELREIPGFIEKIDRLPDAYVRIRLYSVSQDSSRLEKFVEKTLRGETYGEWSDYGRLEVRPEP